MLKFCGDRPLFLSRFAKINRGQRLEALNMILIGNLQKFVYSLGILTFIVSPVAGFSGSVPTWRSPLSHPVESVSLEFTPTEDKDNFNSGGAPAGGYPCLKKWEWPVMVALMPDNDIVTTVSANPTLYIYIPENTAKEAELVVFDQADNAIFETIFKISQTSGLIQINLPETVGLEIGKNYRWYVSLVCDGEDRSFDPFIQGIFRRIELDADLKTQIEREKDALEKARLYAKASIWNETLNIAVDARNQHPKEWEELLKSVKLEKYSQKPFLDCCTLSEPKSINEK